MSPVKTSLICLGEIGGGIDAETAVFKASPWANALRCRLRPELSHQTSSLTKPAVSVVSKFRLPAVWQQTGFKQIGIKSSAVGLSVQSEVRPDLRQQSVNSRLLRIESQ